MTTAKQKSNVLKYILTALFAVTLLLILVNFVLPMMNTGTAEDELNETEISVDLNEEAAEDISDHSVLLNSLLQRQASE